MRPEDIDKIFKERLGNSAPTPPTDMWARLQERLKEDKPVMGVVADEEATATAEPQEKKRGFVWMYSSIAASLSLLLAMGVVFYNINTGTPEINEALTKHDIKPIQEQPVVEPSAAAVTEETLAEQQPEGEAPEEIEKNLTAQATDQPALASNITKAPNTEKAIAKATPKAVQQQAAAKATKYNAPKKADVQQAIATTKVPETPATVEHTVPVSNVKPVVPSALAVAKAEANLNAEPVEIVIKRSVASQTAMAEASTTPEKSNNKVNLAKNIFKQVRNLASGEGMELSELGIRADRVALETQIGKQKISKVINL